MSEIKVGTFTMPAASLGPENPLPPLDVCLPHRLQDEYGRTRKDRDFKAVFLENETLRATFLTEVGGRLWSLFHKPSNRELHPECLVQRWGGMEYSSTWSYSLYMLSSFHSVIAWE